MRIGIIGHFGGPHKFNDGQTVKTVTVYKALMRFGTENRIDKIDTFYVKTNPLKFCADFLKGIVFDEKFLVLLSSNGRDKLFPILSFMCKYMGKEVYHYAIGGRLAREVGENPKLKKYVSSFTGNWMESYALVEQLQKQGIKNAIYLPNFKKLNVVKEDILSRAYHEPYRLCTFSRVMKEKGIEDAIVAVQEINSELGRKAVTLDIYGAAEESYLLHLKKMLQNTSSCRYCGVVDASKSVEALKDYYALLFPTHWRHEGIPGTIIDALSAGLPIIARRWQYCDEMLQHKVTGYIYDFDRPEELKRWILYAVTHVDETLAMKTACITKAQDYSEEHVIKHIAKLMGIEQ